MKKIGIYSGVFDPIHNGHVAFAKAAATQHDLDKVHFIVEAKPRRKANVSDYRHRLNMTWLAVQEEPQLELLAVEDPTFSVDDTLPLLQKRFGDAELHLLMGMDLWNTAHTWLGFDRLAAAVQFIVGSRTNHELASLHQPTHSITTHAVHLTSTMARQADATDLDDIVPQAVARYIGVNQLYAA